MKKHNFGVGVGSKLGNMQLAEKNIIKVKTPIDFIFILPLIDIIFSQFPPKA